MESHQTTEAQLSSWGDICTSLHHPLSGISQAQMSHEKSAFPRLSAQISQHFRLRGGSHASHVWHSHLALTAQVSALLAVGGADAGFGAAEVPGVVQPTHSLFHGETDYGRKTIGKNAEQTLFRVTF